MGYKYTKINGQRVEKSVAKAFQSMRKAFKKRFGLDLLVSSGTRTRAEQTRLYNGWVKRLPGYNLAAAPGYSDHEETGPSSPRALDLRDTGGNAGVTVIGSTRSNWLAANAGRFGFTASGHRFTPREGWHYHYTGRIGGSTGSAGAANLVDVDAKLGASYTKTLQGQLGVSRDGAAGPLTNKALQRRVGTPTDGKWGANSTRKLQAFVGAKVDGIWGGETTRKVKAAIKAGKFGASLKVDGKWGKATTEAIQASVGATVDGKLGPDTYRKLQARVGTAVDGAWGSNSRKALQRHLGVKADGIVGVKTVKALQHRLNAGTF